MKKFPIRSFILNYPMTTLAVSEIYQRRFEHSSHYRNMVWRVLCERYFQSRFKSAKRVMDLGCGNGEFINNFRCEQPHAMDLNPDSWSRLEFARFHKQSSTDPWGIKDLDLVFSSNFFEHLPDYGALLQTLKNARQALCRGGNWLQWDQTGNIAPLITWISSITHCFCLINRFARRWCWPASKLRNVFPNFFHFPVRKNSPLFGC